MNKPPAEELEPRPDPTKSLHFLTDALPIAISEGNYKHMSKEIIDKVERWRSASCDYLLKKKKSFLKTFADDDRETDNVEREKVVFNMERKGTRRRKNNANTIRVKVLKEIAKEKEPDEPSNRRLQLPAAQAFHSYWVLPLMHNLRENLGNETISKNLPLSMMWLLRNCAAVADATPFSLYRELLVIETTLLLDGNEEDCSKECLADMNALKALY